MTTEAFNLALRLWAAGNWRVPHLTWQGQTNQAGHQQGDAHERDEQHNLEERSDTRFEIKGQCATPMQSYF